MKLFVSLFLCVITAAVADPSKTIVENAAATPSLSTLVSVLSLPDYKPVLDALSGPGPFTVFAPTNDAFNHANVDPKQVELVTAVLQYHVLSGAVKSTDLKPLQFVPSLMANPKFVNIGKDAAQVLDITANADGVQIHFADQIAKVVVANVICSNGVVHIVDQVIMLPALTSATAGNVGLNTLVKAAVKAGLVSAVDTTTALTIFAPTEEAFAAIGGIDKVPADKLAEILKYHVVPAIAHSNDVKNGERVPTLNGAKLTLHSALGKVVVNDANVVVADVLTQNGVVHVIDKVLLPPAILAEMAKSVADPSKTIVENAAATPSLSTLVSVLSLPDYKPVLDALSGPGPFTVFAPNNDAFKNADIDPKQVELVTAVLQYHVLSGAVKSTDLKPLQFVPSLMANPKFVNIGKDAAQVLDITANADGVQIYFADRIAKVVVANVICSNGVVHIVDQVIMLPKLTSTTAKLAGLKTLLAAADKAGLVSAVDTTAAVTIFAPTDKAFAAIGGIDKVPADKLAEILKYHVVPAIAHSNDIKDGEQVPTLNGAKLTLHSALGKVVVNDANVVDADILTQNGVVHIIDKVLLPPSTN